MKKELKVCWLSAGVSSFIAGYLIKDSIDKFIYIDIKDQHPDSIRFIKDCEKVLGKPVEILRSSEYENVEQTVLAFGTFFNRKTWFAACTNCLKKRVRKQWEMEHSDYSLTYVWGFDASEKKRADRLNESMSNFKHEFPLIDYNISKEKAHQINKKLGIKRPIMYDMGYPNNNCIGCIKGGMGYWNKIRVDFPEVFDSRAKLERRIGYSILKDKYGKPLYLDELDPNLGRKLKPIIEECGIACELIE